MSFLLLTNIIIEGISAFLSVVAFFAYNLNEWNFIHNAKSRKFLCVTSYVLITLNADDTPLFIVKNGEEPYLLEKINLPYSLDYNVEPPSVCNVGQYYTTYELHIPENSIVDVFEFDTN